MDAILLFIAVIFIVAVGIILALAIVRPRSAARGRNNHRSMNPAWIAFICIFVLELLAGYWVNHVNSMLMVDALSRVANAFYVLNIYPPHLASIGFVWPPLPSFLQLPVLLFEPLFKPLASSALAATIVTAFFTAAGAALIYNCCRRFEVPVWASSVLVALYALNPFIFVYGFNGMSEAIFIFTIVWVITEFVQWIEDEVPVHLMWMGIGLALGFLTRYEAIPFAFTIFLAIVFYSIKRRRARGSRESAYPFFEGTSVVVFTPMLAVILLWLAANYIIMGDALYFMRSQYSNEAYFSYVTFPNLLSMAGNPLTVLEYVAVRSGIFAALFAVILFLRLGTKRLFKWETLMLVAVIISIPFFQYIMLMRGTSYGWLRFFIYPLPIAMAWLPYELGRLGDGRKLLRSAAVIISCVALLATGVLAGMAMNNPDLGWEEYTTYRMENQDLAAQQQVADYINENISGKPILMDSFRTWYVIINLEDTSKVITSCSYNFREAVEEPAAQGVEYLIATVPAGTGVADALNIAYPDIFEKGTEWCELIFDFGDYRIYQIK